MHAQEHDYAQDRRGPCPESECVIVRISSGYVRLPGSVYVPLKAGGVCNKLCTSAGSHSLAASLPPACPPVNSHIKAARSSATARFAGRRSAAQDQGPKEAGDPRPYHTPLCQDSPTLQRSGYNLCIRACLCTRMRICICHSVCVRARACIVCVWKGASNHPPSSGIYLTSWLASRYGTAEVILRYAETKAGQIHLTSRP
jgi:hypothetical protein